MNDHPYVKVSMAWVLAFIPSTMVGWLQAFAYAAAGTYSVYQFYRLWRKK